ncbi:MAG TPA: YbdK family carboxylate-amine ligase [Solirubrobacteraceae bacterium]
MAQPVNVRDAFEVDAPMTVGLEEELMLLNPHTFDLAPRAATVLERVAGDPRFKAELPAAQLEIVLPPAATVGEAATALAAARADLAAAATGVAVVAGAGAHPFADVEGTLSGGERYEAIADEYGWAARRQLAFGQHVHVAVRPAERALAVYNALRSYLPLVAALAANAPFYGGVDTGLASVRPKLCDLLPRQGVPPPMASWDELEGAMRWGIAAGAMVHHAQWWWEARLHPLFGTLEVRVPDTQTTVAEAAAVAAVVHALVAWLAERHGAGDTPPVAPSWRIAENRWSACRHGLEGTMADLVSGAVAPTRARAAALLDDLEGAAERVGCAAELAAARAGLARARAGAEPARPALLNGAARQRTAAAGGGPRGVAAWLAERFLG